MKRLIAIICALCIVFSFSACSKNEKKAEATTEQTSAKAVDVDLTKLSSTMVYSEVYNMMIYPDKYVGKTVKMQGQYNEYYDEETDKTYYACVIADATACCQQGLEFVLTDEFDALGIINNDNIEVVGTFNIYNEGELQYFHLTDASIKSL